MPENSDDFLTDRPPSTPEYLFKYTKLEYLLGILDRCELYFPSPTTFNDPFDCQIRPSFDKDPAVLSRHYQRMLKKDGLSRAERRRRTKELQPAKSFFETAFEMTADDIRKTRGVLCLSATNDDILMWSHYAEKHSGFCLRFATSSEFFAGVRPVHYSDTYPTMDFMRLVEDQSLPSEIGERAKKEMETKLYLTKSKHWTYEQEWRLGRFPLTESTVGNHAFPPETLTGIIFGARCSEGAIERIRKRVQISKCKPELFRAQVSRSRFELEIRSLV